MLRAVLFDCDGVLLDSETIYLACVSEYLKSLGKTASAEELAYLVGTDMNHITEQLKQDYGLEAYDTEELIRGQRALFHNVFYGGGLTPMRQLVPFLIRLKGEGIATAVASSSSQEYVEYVLDQLGIRAYFDVYLGREAAKRAKPCPDLYEEAMRRLGIRAGDAVVIEDSYNGIRAGLDAGCYVIAYRGAKVRQDTSQAHETVWEYDEIDIPALNKRMESLWVRETEIIGE